MIQPGTLVQHKTYPEELYVVLGRVFPPDKTKKYTRYQTNMLRLLLLGEDNIIRTSHVTYLEIIQ